ncbi:hypothetical protein PR202_ga13032 [Eleusine coracana subsp. coracana]|uniref:Uncharacterized protein n=1 Tax=Eleusine coracana subsp. coracana TaxID=191504 RepID=A0AAV5CDV0_ELECO|nr:hypothetical protein PR202_ga13032 [Eleusine coracana subsp. coracana]
MGQTRGMPFPVDGFPKAAGDFLGPFPGRVAFPGIGLGSPSGLEFPKEALHTPFHNPLHCRLPATAIHSLAQAWPGEEATSLPPARPLLPIRAMCGRERSMSSLRCVVPSSARPSNVAAAQHARNLPLASCADLVAARQRSHLTSCGAATPVRCPPTVRRACPSALQPC